MVVLQTNLAVHFVRFSCLFRLVVLLNTQPIDHLSHLLVVHYFRCCFHGNRLCHGISGDISFRCISMVSRHLSVHGVRYGWVPFFQQAHSRGTEFLFRSEHESRKEKSSFDFDYTLFCKHTEFINKYNLSMTFCLK